MCPRVRAVLLATAAAFSLLPAAVLAQTGSVTGTVRDSQGAPLAGVMVDITGPPLIEKTRTTGTDQDGRYSMVNLPVGSYYKVSFRLESFATTEHGEFDVRGGATMVIDAEMKPGPPPIVSEFGPVIRDVPGEVGAVLLRVPTRVPAL